MGEMARKFYGRDSVPGAKKAPKQVTVRRATKQAQMPAPRPQPMMQGVPSQGMPRNYVPSPAARAGYSYYAAPSFGQVGQQIAGAFEMFDAAFCRDIEPFLAELQQLLGVANDAGLSSAYEVQSAQAVYDDISGFLLYVPLPFVEDKCFKHQQEVLATITRLRAFLASQSVDAPESLRPDAAPGAELALPSWVPLVLVGAVAIYFMSSIKALVPQRQRR